MFTLLTVHGEIRWLVVLVGAAAALRFAFGWWRGAAYTAADRGLMAAFSGVLDLNLLLGLVLLFSLGGGFPSHRLEHATTMFVAVGLAHATAAWRGSASATKKFRNNLLVVLAALALVATGVIRLRGGWIFR